jgi:hypothetical protein
MTSPAEAGLYVAIVLREGQRLKVFRWVIPVATRAAATISGLVFKMPMTRHGDQPHYRHRITTEVYLSDLSTANAIENKRFS